MLEPLYARSAEVIFCFFIVFFQVKGLSDAPVQNKRPPGIQHIKFTLFSAILRRNKLECLYVGKFFSV